MIAVLSAIGLGVLFAIGERLATAALYVLTPWATAVGALVLVDIVSAGWWLVWAVLPLVVVAVVRGYLVGIGFGPRGYTQPTTTGGGS